MEFRRKLTSILCFLLSSHHRIQFSAIFPTSHLTWLRSFMLFNVLPRVFSLSFILFFFFFTRPGQDEKHLSLILLPSLKFTIFLILYKKHNNTRVIYELRNGPSSHRVSVAVALERGIRRSEVRFLMSHARNKRKNNFFFILSCFWESVI